MRRCSFVNLTLLLLLLFLPRFECLVLAAGTAVVVVVVVACVVMVCLVNQQNKWPWLGADRRADNGALCKIHSVVLYPHRTSYKTDADTLDKWLCNPCANSSLC